MTDPLQPAIAGMHRLLLHVAGRLPDDVLAELRRQLADADWVYLAEAVSAELTTRGVPVLASDVAALAAFHRAVTGEERVRLIEKIPVAAALPATEHRFAPAAGSATGQPRDAIDDAMVRAVALLPGAKAMWRSWRETPGRAGVWERVYLVEVGHDAWRAVGELQRAAAAASAEPPRVEVYSPGEELSPYQFSLGPAAELLWYADGPPPTATDGADAGRLLVDRVIAAARAGDEQTVRRLVDWALLGAPNLAHAMAGFTAAGRREAAPGLAMLFDAVQDEPRDPTAVAGPLRQLVTALRDAEEVRSPDEAERQAWLRELRVPDVPGEGLTAEQVAQLAWLRERAAAISEVYLVVVRDGRVLPLAVTPERDRLVAVFG